MRGRGDLGLGNLDRYDRRLHIARHRIRSGSQTIKITVPRAPSRAGIDPYRKLIDREREDNVVAVKAAGAK